MENKLEMLINELASACGIIPEYWDIFGNKHIASTESKKSALKAMGFDKLSEDSLSVYIETLKNSSWTRLIEPVFIVPLHTQSLTIPVSIQADMEEEKSLSIFWSLSLNGGNKKHSSHVIKAPPIKGESIIGGKRYIKTLINLSGNPDSKELGFGYYDLKVSANIGQRTIIGTSKVVITPNQCYIKPSQREGKNLWGLSLNLYSLRSNHNWGIGDLRDLKLCVNETTKLGGAFVGINPLHAIANQHPFGISPYSPISRLFRNFLYLDIEKVEGFDRLQLKGEILKEIDALRRLEHIDYKAVADIKTKALEILFENFYNNHIKRDSKKAMHFKAYLKEQGENLESFALYCAIAKHQGAHNENYSSKAPLYSWRSWDRSFHSPNSKETSLFKDKHKRAVLFYCFIQWQIDCQLKDIHKDSCTMEIGLYNDLAVGSIRDGYDEWIYQGIFATAANAGAPPDDFNPAGQDWGFPPMNPLQLRDNAYEPLVQCLRSNMKYAGALRIDHALGLFRMFWIPSGSKPSEGVYVEYPWQDILRLIALESHINKTVIIAEDLGTITDQAREALKNFNMLSYRLLYFQRNYPDPSFVAPQDYPDAALCAVTTHDLPTLKGYWLGRDIELRKRLSLFKSEESYIQCLRDRERDKRLLVESLIRFGILPQDFSSNYDMDFRLITAVYEFLAMARSKLLALSLDDLMGTADQQNMPGTVQEYPCWIQKTPMLIEDFFRSDNMAILSRMLKRYRWNPHTHN